MTKNLDTSPIAIESPEQMSGVSLLDVATATIASLIVLSVYALTLGPTITGEDSGELVAAAYTMGIAHPPGYPLWCILGKLFTFIPFGTVAWRVNLMSATLGAATVFVIAFIILHLTRNRLAAAVGAIAFGFSREFWEQSVIAEVYSLNAFLVATCILLLLRWRETRRPGPLYAFAVTFGLGLCNHNTMMFLGPPFVLFVFLTDGAPWLRYRFYLSLAALSIFVVVAVHTYLPIRSLANPPIDWGNPETWQGFWDVVLRKHYSFGFDENPVSAMGYLRQIGVFFSKYFWGFAPWLAWIPLLGLWPLWKRERFAFGFIVGVFAWISIGFTLVLNFELDKESIWLNNVFWIPSYMMAAICIGIALDWIAELSFPRAKVVAAIIGIVVVSSPLALHYDQNDKSNYYFSHDFGMNVLTTLEPNAIYFPTADHATFPAMYLQAVEGVRPDVFIANKYGYPEPSVYEGMPEDFKAQFIRLPNEAQERQIEAWVIENSGRPVYFSTKQSTGADATYELANAGLLFRAVRTGEPFEPRDYWSEYTWHTLEADEAIGELTAEMVVSDYHFFRARDYLANGEKEAGLAELDRSVAVWGGSEESFNNLGSAAAEYGHHDAAIAYYKKALELDPDYETVLRNLAKLHFQKDEYHEALRYIERILRKEPLDQDMNWMASDCLKGQLRFDEAASQYERMAKFLSDDYRIFRELGFIYLDHQGQTAKAQKAFERSYDLNPMQQDVAQLLGKTESERDPLTPQQPETPTLPDALQPALPDIPGFELPNTGAPQLPSTQVPAVPAP